MRPSVSSESVSIIYPRRRRSAFRYVMYASINLVVEVSVFGVSLEFDMLYLGGA